MLEWLIGAAIVGTIAYVARGALSSSGSSGGGAPATDPTKDGGTGGGVFAINNIFSVDDAVTCRPAVDKWISTLAAADQVQVTKAISEGDSGFLETAASYQDGANPALAKCIRAMKPHIIPSTPITSPFILNPMVFSGALSSAQLRAALNTCMAGSGMPADLQNHTNEVFDAEPTRAKIALIADALRLAYPTVASCLDAIPA